MYLFVSSDPDSNVYNIGLMRSIMGNALESVSPSRLRALAPRYKDTKRYRDTDGLWGRRDMRHKLFSAPQLYDTTLWHTV